VVWVCCLCMVTYGLGNSTLCGKIPLRLGLLIHLERPLFGLWRLIWIATIRVVQMVLMQGYYVRMLSTKGKSACRTNGPEALHQRLNVEHPSSSWFCQWLVGVTDGDGTFSISPGLGTVQDQGKQNNSWNLPLDLSQGQKHKGNYSKLESIQAFLRNLRRKRASPTLWDRLEANRTEDRRMKV